MHLALCGERWLVEVMLMASWRLRSWDGNFVVTWSSALLELVSVWDVARYALGLWSQEILVGIERSQGIIDWSLSIVRRLEDCEGLQWLVLAGRQVMLSRSLALQVIESLCLRWSALLCDKLRRWGTSSNLSRYLNVPWKDAFELIPYEGIVRDILILQSLYVIEDLSHLWYILRGYPKFLLRIVNAICLDVLHLIHSVLLLLSPLKFLIQKVQYHKVQAPKVISSR